MGVARGCGCGIGLQGYKVRVGVTVATQVVYLVVRAASLSGCLVVVWWSPVGCGRFRRGPTGLARGATRTKRGRETPEDNSAAAPVRVLHVLSGDERGLELVVRIAVAATRCVRVARIGSRIRRGGGGGGGEVGVPGGGGIRPTERGGITRAGEGGGRRRLVRGVGGGDAVVGIVAIRRVEAVRVAAGETWSPGPSRGGDPARGPRRAGRDGLRRRGMTRSRASWRCHSQDIA